MDAMPELLKEPFLRGGSLVPDTAGRDTSRTSIENERSSYEGESEVV
jgi:hypothetical protein